MEIYTGSFQINTKGETDIIDITVPFSEGRLILGTWQQIILIDFDNRSRSREITVQIIGSAIFKVWMLKNLLNFFESYSSFRIFPKTSLPLKK